MVENILLCDLGGTHARFARYVSRGQYDHFKKYRLQDFTAFEDIIRAYYDETGQTFQSARFATATDPINGVINYSRFAGDPIAHIDFNLCEQKFGWIPQNVRYLNDLEAGAYGLPLLSDDTVKCICRQKNESNIQWNNHKILISIGTGAGHAALFHDHVLRTVGGHFLPVTVTEEHRKVEQYIKQSKNNDLSLIAENFVSARGLSMIAEILIGKSYKDIPFEDLLNDLHNYPDVIRLFFEFLGIHVQTIVSVMGFYGGVYLGGGVMDHLIKNNLTNWDAFEAYFRPNMVSVVNDRLYATPVYYILHDEMPLLGLTTLNNDF